VPDPDPSDPYRTAALRGVVLDAWAASPARFREDANAEEALFVGGYAGRVLVELAANAADAAREAGVPAVLRLRLQEQELRVANTGAPLTAAGVSALSSLRASAKRDSLATVGHFGVGFTAVLTWSSSPSIVSAGGGVRFDRQRTQAAVALLDQPDLNREVQLREGLVPVLRLPWPTDPGEEPPPDGFTTEVRLPLTPGAVADVLRLLAQVGTAEDLFWALPDVAGIDLDGRMFRRWVEPDGITVIDDGHQTGRFRTAQRSGRIPAALLTDRPVEERRRGIWQITWALPIGPDRAAGVELDDSFAAAATAGSRSRSASTVGAPTPTDEPVSLPARLVGTFPVDDTRRRLATGPLQDHLIRQAVDCYLDLVAATDPGDRWELLPTAGFPLGSVDGELRAGILEAFSAMPLLVTAVGDEVLPRAACLLPGLSERGTTLFGQAIPGLLPPVRGPALAAMRAVGVSTLTLSQACAALSGIDRDPEFWWQVYDAVATVDRAPDPEDLADIPVPLAGGRRSLGARGCLLPDAGGRHGESSGPPASAAIDVDLANRAGRVIPELRIVDPRAVHPLLERLGARPADPDALLSDPGMIAAVRRLRRELDDADPDPAQLRDVAEVVLDLVAAGGRSEVAPLADLVLTDEDGRPWPAGELLAPAAPLRSVLASDADLPVVAGEWVERYDTAVLAAIGVRSGFGVIHVSDPLDEDVDLPDLDEWLDLTRAQTQGQGPPLMALTDLDLVDDDRWPAALALIASDRSARDCLSGNGSALSYSGWWLSRNALIQGHPPAAWRLPGATDLAGLYDPLPIVLDDALARGVGVRSDLATAARQDPQDVIDRLADGRRTVAAGRVPAVTAAVVAAILDSAVVETEFDLPSGVRTLSGDVVDAGRAWVLDAAWLAQVIPAAGLVPGGADPLQVGEVLDLPMASDRVRATVVGDEAARAVAADADVDDGALRRSAAALAVDISGSRIIEIAGLRVSVDGGEPVRVLWWGSGDRLWVDGSADAAGRAVAWSSGRWADRHTAIAAARAAPVELAENGIG